MNRKLKRTIITVISVVLLALCLSVGVTASKNNVGTVSKLKSTVTATSVTLKWSKAKNAKGYQISVKSGKKWKTVATVTSTTCKINGLKAGTKYTYRVKAYGKNGKKKVWAKKTKDISVLTAPKKVSGLKGSISGKTATLKWKKTTGATAYRVYQYNSSKKKWVEIKKTTSLKATVKKLEAGKTYKFAVKAYIKKDKLSALSSSYATVSLTVKPDNVSALKVTGKTDSSVTLSWQKAKGATAYAVYKYNSSNGKWTTLISSTKNTTVTIGKLSPDTSYIFSVRAITKVGKTSHYSSKYMQIATVTNKKVTAPPTVKPTTPPTTNPAPIVTLPKSKAEIAAAYNKAVNDLKNYKGIVNMKKEEHIPVSLTDLSEPRLLSVFNMILEKMTSTSPEEYNFDNGVDVADPDRKLTAKIIPTGRAADVKAAGLSSATATANADGGYTLVLTFIPEKSVFDGVNNTAEAVYHTGATDTLQLGTLDLSPLEIYGAETKYPGTELTATVDGHGRLIRLTQQLPFHIDGEGKMMSFGYEAILEGSLNITYEFAYEDSQEPVSLIVNSHAYGDGVIYVEVDPSNWNGTFIDASILVPIKVNGTALKTPATCTVPSKKTGSIYEIKISIPSQSVNPGDVVSFTIPKGIIKNEPGTQYNLSYSSSITV